VKAAGVLALIVLVNSSVPPSASAALGPYLELQLGGAYSPTRYNAVQDAGVLKGDENGAFQSSGAVLLRFGRVIAFGVSVAHWRYTDQSIIGRAYFTPISMPFRAYLPLGPMSPYVGIGPSLVFSDWGPPAKYESGLGVEAGVRVSVTPSLGFDIGASRLTSGDSALHLHDAGPYTLHGPEAISVHLRVSILTSTR
jgi:hypothetical protein